MASSNRLCAYCVQVPFDVEILRAYKGDSWRLGTTGRIRCSDCPFCRIVSFALYEERRARAGYVTPNVEIELRWYWKAGPSEEGSFKVDVRGLLGAISICFVRNSTRDYRLDKAFCLTPNLGQALDLGRVKRWLSECTTNHGGDCSAIVANNYDLRIQENYVGLELLRFIDVQRECIVETRVMYRYVALSYVWGSTTNFRLLSSNISDMAKPYSLRAIRLPQTIEDAITFVGGLGEQYLWCDALCLLQNDPKDVSQGINAMDLIYERALLTIVAACGHDANSGLPGVREGTRYMPRYPEDVVSGVQLDVYLDLDTAMKHSLYSSRAWTLQEDMLSRRAVYFVDNRVYFRCRSTTLYEFCDPGLDSYKRRPHISQVSLLPGSVHMIEPMEDFKIILLYYSKRSLTHQQDALRALAGIIRRLSDRMKCRFIEGLPSAALDLFILFRGYSSRLRRRNGFPSYSWTGWTGPLIVIESGLNEFLKQNTWIVWYKRSTTGTTNLVWDPLANESFPYNDPEYIGYRKRLPFHCPSTLSFPTTRTQPTFDITLASTARSYSVLQLWTLSVYFNIKIVSMIDGIAHILDKFGDTCGLLFLDGLENTTFFTSAGPFELIALSAATSQLWIMIDVELIRIFKDANFHEEDELYNVIVLEWSEGVAERRGIGVVRQRSVTNSIPRGPVWKEILLA